MPNTALNAVPRINHQRWDSIGDEEAQLTVSLGAYVRCLRIRGCLCLCTRLLRLLVGATGVNKCIANKLGDDVYVLR